MLKFSQLNNYDGHSEDQTHAKIGSCTETLHDTCAVLKNTLADAAPDLRL